MAKPPVHVTDITKDPPVIIRVKAPRFRATFELQTKHISNVTWIDQEPEQNKSISVLKKAQAYLKFGIKNEIQ